MFEWFLSMPLEVTNTHTQKKKEKRNGVASFPLWFVRKKNNNKLYNQLFDNDKQDGEEINILTLRALTIFESF